MESSKGSSYSPSNGEFIVQEKRWSGRCGWFDSFLLSVSSFSFLRKNLPRIEYEKYVYFKFARIKDTTWNVSLRWKTFSSILLGSIKHWYVGMDGTNRTMIFLNNFGTLLYNNLFLSISRYLQRKQTTNHLFIGY